MILMNLACAVTRLRYRAVTSESFWGRELSAHILLTSVRRVVLNGLCVDALNEQSRQRALESAWHQLYLLTASRLPLDVVVLSAGHLQTPIAQHYTSVYTTVNVAQGPRVGFGAQVWYHCRISPPRFLAECRKRRLNQGSFVVLCFNLSALSDLY